jgi:hypothetical protein
MVRDTFPRFVNVVQFLVVNCELKSLGILELFALY